MTLTELQKKFRENEAKIRNLRAQNDGVESIDDSVIDELETLMSEQDKIKRSIDVLVKSDEKRDVPDFATDIEPESRSLDVKVGEPAVSEKEYTANEQMLDIYMEAMHRTNQRSLPSAQYEKIRDRLHTRSNTAFKNANKGRAVLGTTTQVDAEGGYMLETKTVQNMFESVIRESPFLERCDTLPVDPGNIAVKWGYLDEGTTGDNPAGMYAYWASEAETVSLTNIKMKEKTIELHKIMAISATTSEMLKIPNYWTSIVQANMPKVFRRKLESSVIASDGVGKPLGILNLRKSTETPPGPLVVAPAEGGQTESFVPKNFPEMWEKCPFYPDERRQVVWLAHPDCEKVWESMAWDFSAGDVPVFVTSGGGFVDGVTGIPSLKGRPVFFTDHCSAVGTEGDLILTNLNQYLILTQGGLDYAVSIHVEFLTDQQVFRWIMYVGGGAKPDAPIYVKNSTTKRGYFVTLATR
jgi:HK97 family phage major capsid protein